jgi:hypothetical protein
MAGGQASGGDIISSSAESQNGLLNNLKLIARYVDLSVNSSSAYNTINNYHH